MLVTFSYITPQLKSLQCLGREWGGEEGWVGSGEGGVDGEGRIGDRVGFGAVVTSDRCIVRKTLWSLK